MALPEHLGSGYEAMLKKRDRRRKLNRSLDRFGAVGVAREISHRLAGGHVRVINYHDIAPEHEAQFVEHVRYYAEHFIPADADDLVDVANGKTDKFADRPGLIITFDDGFVSHHKIAAPVLAEHGFSGWFFVPTSAPGLAPAEQEGWAKEHGVIPDAADYGGRQVFASWENLRELSTNHVVGSHTDSHLRLGDQITVDDAIRELDTSTARIKAELGVDCLSFCWVGGEIESYSPVADAEVRSRGIRFAFRTCSLPVRRGADLLAIDRTNIEADYPLAEVRAQLSGLTDARYLLKRRTVNDKLGLRA